MTPATSHRRRQRGNALIEFALSFSFLVPIFVGTYSFGYAFYVYDSLASAVRAGARFASLQTYNSPTTTPSAAYLTAVRNMVVYGDPAGGTTPVRAGLRPENVSVTMTFQNGVPREVAVAIQNFQINSVVDTIDLAQKPRFSVPYTGRFDPLF
ncbi:MAG: pilus assembly protein [Bryobacteraceae bacterium]|nr:pilus assembly protein [Bryobacteraceae bacterium]